jgi:hypothetical protein
MLGGFEWNYKRFNLTGEYIHKTFNNILIPSGGVAPRGDGEREGYWIRAMYAFNPKWSVGVQKSLSDVYKTGLAGKTTMVSDKWDAIDLILDYNLTPESTIIFQYERANGHRSDGSDSIQFDRFLMGWVTTF